MDYRHTIANKYSGRDYKDKRRYGTMREPVRNL